VVEDERSQTKIQSDGGTGSKPSSSRSRGSRWPESERYGTVSSEKETSAGDRVNASNDAIFSFTSVLFSGWLERGNHLFARRGAFKEPLQKVAHSHTRPVSGQYRFGLTNRGELTTHTGLETFHPFTHEKATVRQTHRVYEIRTMRSLHTYANDHPQYEILGKYKR